MSVYTCQYGMFRARHLVKIQSAYPSLILQVPLSTLEHVHVYSYYLQLIDGALLTAACTYVCTHRTKCFSNTSSLNFFVLKVYSEMFFHDVLVKEG